LIRLLPLLFFCILATDAGADWRLALPGWKYEFPRDHGNHPEFKTEWWYFSGNLTSADGRAFGYQLTFFRQGVMPLDADIIPLSRFVTSSVKFAHFAISDLSIGRFRFFQKLSRGAYGEAGFGRDSKLAWIEDWSCVLGDDGVFRIRGNDGDVGLELTLRPAKPLIIHGRDGVSQKSDGRGRASHYYSFTRLSSEGFLRVGDQRFAVSGSSWFDHEWATNQLAANQAGWDWLGLQLADGNELMLIHFRTKNGEPDPNSSATFVDAQGVATTLSSADFSFDPLETWVSSQTKASYPVRWQIVIPRLNLRLEVSAALKDQELFLKPVAYWEGAVRATGTTAQGEAKGSGYLEMTGYAQGMAEIQAQPDGQ
jgi:predicted secreted hydrolase